VDGSEGFSADSTDICSATMARFLLHTNTLSVVGLWAAERSGRVLSDESQISPNRKRGLRRSVGVALVGRTGVNFSQHEQRKLRYKRTA
jgi:hypothetical protein